MSQSLFDWTGHGGHDPDKHQQLMDYPQMEETRTLYISPEMATPENIRAVNRYGRAEHAGFTSGTSGDYVITFSKPEQQKQAKAFIDRQRNSPLKITSM